MNLEPRSSIHPVKSFAVMTLGHRKIGLEGSTKVIGEASSVTSSGSLVML